jgi:heme exporter protein C
VSRPAAFLLWIWISAVIVAAFHWAPLAEGFKGESSRILFFHVPMAWVSFVAFMTAGVQSVRYLARRSGAGAEHAERETRLDRSAAAAVELGIVFAALATITGSIWARIMWGSYWNWDPRESAIVVALLFYAAYLALRQAVVDDDARARLSAVYAALGLAVSPFLYFVLPRLGFTLHPEPVINTQGKMEVEARMLTVLLASSAGFTALFYWMHALRCRVAALAELRSEADLATAPEPEPERELALSDGRSR